MGSEMCIRDSVASVFTAGGLAVTKKAYIGTDFDIGAGNFTVVGLSLIHI